MSTAPSPAPPAPTPPSRAPPSPTPGRAGPAKAPWALLVVATCLLALVPRVASAQPEVRSLTITAPADGSVRAPGPVQVRGTIGGGGGTGATVVFAIDVSGSTAWSVQDCNGDGVIDAADDLNGDGVRGDILDCEIAATLAMLDSLQGRSDVRVGLLAFGTSAASADLSAAAGVQEFAFASDQAELREALRSFRRGSIGAFTQRGVGQGTSFTAPLSVAHSMFDAERVASGAATNEVLYFLSDGDASISSTAPTLTGLAARGVTTNTYGIGSGARGCDPGAPLRTISDASNGVCTVVGDPSALVAAVTGTVGSTDVELTLTELDSGASEPVRTLPSSGLGEWATTFDHLGPGRYEAVAAAGALEDRVRFVIEEPAASPDPADPADPAESADPTGSADPAVPAAPVEVPEPAVPADPTAGDDPTGAEPVGSEEPTGREEPDPAGEAEVRGASTVVEASPATVRSVVGMSNLAMTGISSLQMALGAVALVMAGLGLTLLALGRARRQTTE